MKHISKNTHGYCGLQWKLSKLVQILPKSSAFLVGDQICPWSKPRSLSLPTNRLHSQLCFACNQKHFLHFHNLFSLSEQHSEQDKGEAWQVLLFCFAKSWRRREIEGPVSTFVTSGLFSQALNLQRCLEAARIMPTFKILISNSTFHLVQLICQKGKEKEWMRNI